MEKDNQKLVTRFVLYLLGMLLLALGLTLNTLTGLGASAIVSIPFTISEGTGLNFGNLTLVAYCVLVAAQFVVKGKNRTWVDLLQLVVSLVFTRFLNVFKAMIPYKSGFLPADISLLVVAIICGGNGIGILAAGLIWKFTGNIPGAIAAVVAITVVAFVCAMALIVHHNRKQH